MRGFPLDAGWLLDVLGLTVAAKVLYKRLSGGAVAPSPGGLNGRMPVSTLGVVTAAYDYDDLHRLVDRLTPGQVRALRAVALELVESQSDEFEPSAAAGEGRRRRLSFAGLMDAEPDLAARSEDILRAEFGHHSE